MKPKRINTTAMKGGGDRMMNGTSYQAVVKHIKL